MKKILIPLAKIYIKIDNFLLYFIAGKDVSQLLSSFVYATVSKVFDNIIRKNIVNNIDKYL